MGQAVECSDISIPMRSQMRCRTTLSKQQRRSLTYIRMGCDTCCYNKNGSIHSFQLEGEQSNNASIQDTSAAFSLDRARYIFHVLYYPSAFCNTLLAKPLMGRPCADQPTATRLLLRPIVQAHQQGYQGTQSSSKGSSQDRSPV